MEFRPVDRAPGAFQRSVGAGDIDAMCRRCFGADARVVSAVELGYGAYNNTYRVDMTGHRPVILRVAPRPAAQFRIERELMRNEHATTPFLAGIAAPIPRTLAVDFTHQLIGRDYLFQTLLDGIPAPDGLPGYPRPEWAGFYRQLGTITRSVHDVRGHGFGPVAGPGSDTWSAALIEFFQQAADDLTDAGLPGDDMHRLAHAAIAHRDTLDDITEPRLLHGDLWTVNVLIDPAVPRPTITGVCDGDRGWWGDPLADWTIHLAGQRPGTERDAFWDTYGRPSSTPGGHLRAQFYRARHISAVRLERHRLGQADRVPPTYTAIHDVLTEITNVG